MEIKGATVTMHYPKSDKDFYGDYSDVTINVYGGKDKSWHMDYGDSYHDKGWEKSQGFVDCLKVIFRSKLPILFLRQADREDY